MYQNVSAARDRKPPTNRTHTAVENGDDALRFFQPEVVIEAVEKMVKIVRAEL